MRVSWLSRTILAGVSVAAACGWMGIRLAPATESPLSALLAVDAVEAPVPAEGPTVRNRNAWQPSPMPSQAQVQQPSQTSQPNAAQPQPLPGIGGVPAIGIGGAALAVPVPVAGPKGASVPDVPGAVLQPRNSSVTSPEIEAVASAAGFVPMSRMFTADLLEDVFDGGLPAQRGYWDIVEFNSKSLGRKDSYMVWLPPGYGSSGKQRYPTLYLLHGVGGEAGFGVEEWLGYALTEDLDRMTALGLIEPMIVVLPNGEQGYWMNHADGGPKWADYVALDIVKDVDSRYRTIPQREKRAIGGLSMGGHGALQIALNRPETFSIAGAHSPTLRPFEDSPEFFGDQKWFAKYDPLSLARSSKAVKRITTWIDVGYDDEWRGATQQLVQTLERRGGRVQFTVLEGEHEGWYWEYYLPEYLNFYSSALRATAKTPEGAPVVATTPIGSAFVSIAKASGSSVASAPGWGPVDVAGFVTAADTHS
jgi:enterochelin esterase-like enzyme